MARATQSEPGRAALRGLAAQSCGDVSGGEIRHERCEALSLHWQRRSKLAAVDAVHGGDGQRSKELCVHVGRRRRRPRELGARPNIFLLCLAQGPQTTRGEPRLPRSQTDKALQRLHGGEYQRPGL